MGKFNYTVKQIDATSARDLVTRFHYSGKVVTNSNLHLGIFKEEEDSFFGEDALVGVLSYGPPMNGPITSSKISEELDMVELNRMVMADEEPRNAESKAISLCNKWLRKNTNIKWILSFSDGKEGNVGYIYQATNWKYLGYILSDSFYDLDGDIVHSVTVWHRYKERHELRGTHTTNEILRLNYKNVSVITCKQHLYVFPLYKNVKFNFETRVYPKLETEVPIIRRKWLKRNGNDIEELITYSDELLIPVF